ncbi:hypothetical protein LWI28_021417 [Acer negundo]|uniref:Uncharacterized protein n=1 Tax=Acer negundo TaxID=4023 RepID=A0AAD5J660_ACENE|nr:hypothetical protein LWI28_021417 [Acer negundo]
MAESHGAARAVDKPGQHDFNLLKKLVLPDGSILRAKLPRRPTRDCLFSDPARDGKILLKIWNLNDFTGVMGVFNCQGATDMLEQKMSITCLESLLINGLAIQSYIPILVEFFNNEDKLAPIGLIKMFNSGGAIKELRYDEAEGTATADMKVRGCGLFGAYSSARPKRIQVDSEEVQFGYNEVSGLVTLILEFRRQNCTFGTQHHCSTLLPPDSTNQFNNSRYGSKFTDLK